MLFRSSVHLHYHTAGQTAAGLLLQLLADPDAAPQKRMLSYELKRRTSTGDENSAEDIWAK